VIFWCDIFVILVLIFVGVLMLWAAFRDIRKDWPWLFSALSDAWVVGYILFNRWRRRRDAPHYDEPLLAHVERAINDIEHQMWLSRYSFWWYLLPIALGCIVPPVLFFAMDYSRNAQWRLLITLLSTLGSFVAVFTSVYLVMKYGRRLGEDRSRRELEALRALRETLLNVEE
jgi:hypothetical protein